jgi:rod shape-determining protein MreC
VKVVIVIALLLASLLAIISGFSGQNIPSMLVQSALAPLRNGAGTVMNQVQQVYDYIFRYEQLEAENAALREQLSQIQKEALEAEALRRENERLQALAGLLADNEDFKVVDAYIIARSTANEWVNTLTVNRGSTAGIAEGMCAITENGEVVGIVVEVGPNYAVIRTVLDSALGISATISESGYDGIVSGGYASGHKDLMRMDYLASAAVLRNNDLVVTSGSTVYPRNLILGHIVDAGFANSGAAKYAYVKPAVNIPELEQVFIITSFEAN